MLTNTSISQNRQKRNSALELLRIIAMVMITFHHFAYHGGFEWGNTAIATRFWHNFIVMGGKIGVDIFVLISGYFLCASEEQCINLKRIMKFWGQVFFYSVLFYLIFKLFGSTDHEISVKEAICNFFPITFSRYWFASTYFTMYLIHPYLNKLLMMLDKKAYQGLVTLIVICWSIIPTFTTSSFQGNSFIWFICLYIIAGYIRFFGFNMNLKCKHYFVMWILFTLLTYASSIVFTILGTKWDVFSSNATYFYGQEKITSLLISLTLFMTFLNLKMNYHKWINLFATATFGVYLIHDNKYVRPFLWKTVFKNATYQNSLILIPYSVLVVTIVYVCCSLIDLGRKQFIEKSFMIVVEKYSERILKPFESIIQFAKNTVFGKQ